ncbi:hypothetical protein A3A70_02020 [candidate division WWE3 bacterium RIFCSPLOWO2_01_FULL_42_11]|uniref:Uncharacterized protein n=1 Tax=candidate division WWE3 bacterium RIFCSPLOWO2_01_FULL_42_11 TaxID=1802627 RepID=A0A1F4VRQ1_UNCKA|nr:MAG: hypothetical protein A3A70_02020 [candidate division WWE3 bacterium RIFCSPLOWO2_01_FULL_42_11]
MDLLQRIFLLPLGLTGISWVILFFYSYRFRGGWEGMIKDCLQPKVLVGLVALFIIFTIFRVVFLSFS